MKNSVLVVSLCLGGFASSAIAAEVSIKGNINETIDASDNYFLTHTPSGYTLRSLSAINLNALAATPTTRYLLDSNYSYYKYAGPGAADTSLTWGTPASAKFSVDHTTPLTKYKFATSWDRRDLATALLEQSGTASGRGSVNTYYVDGGLTHDLSPRDSISWSARGTTASYSDPSQTPYVDGTTTVAWNHKLNPTTTLTNSVNFDWFAADNAANSQRLFWQIMTGFQTQLSNRLHFNASVGEVFVNAYQHGVLPSTIPTNSTSFQLQAGAANGWIANGGLNYQLFADTRVSLNATKAITPTITGQLQKIESIGLGLNHDINHSSNLAFLAQFSHLTSNTGTSSDTFTASANYGYRLTRDWWTNLSYTYRQRNDETGLAKSSTVLFGLKHDFTVLGQPPVDVKKTSADVIKEQQERAQQALPALSR